MRLERILGLADFGLGFDTETHKIQQGLLVPPLVCGSAAWFEPGPTIQGLLLDKQTTLETFAEALDDPNRIIVGANISFDAAVLANEFAKRGIDVMPDIFRALAEDRVYDIQIAEALHGVAYGMLNKDPRTGGPLLNPETGRRGRYSLATCVDLVLGRLDAKANDEWRERYSELEFVPIADWPPVARDYPIDDAKNTLEVALAQAGLIVKTSTKHEWGPRGACIHCGSTRFSTACMVRQRHKNLHDLSNQVWTAFSMHAGAAWGFHVNQASVDIIEKYALRNRDGGMKPFLDASLIRSDGSEDRSELKRRVAIAYGASGTCETCNGTGKVPSPAAKPIRCTDCKGRCQPWKAGGKIKEPTVEYCATCKNTAQIPNPNPAMVICFAYSGETDKNGEPVKVKTCDGTGMILNEDVPRSEKEGIGYGRDCLSESGDEFLMSYADYQEDAKDLNVYIPYLRKARAPINGHGSECPVFKGDKKDNECICQGPYFEIPLTLRPNVILATGRTSYDGVIQLFKRQPGHLDLETKEYIPSLRECIQARPRHVLGTIDYDSGELVTHAQSCIWTTGYSSLAEALRSGVKVHNALGATMIGFSYEEFQARVKEKWCKNARQAAKPGNFGFPGGMGPVKMVLQQRKQGPDTPHESGPQEITITDDNGNQQKVRGYKGLRFCILMHNAEACGVRKTTIWKQNRIPPTCVECIECAIRLKEIWLRQWPENTQYFKFINDCVRNGMYISPESLERWPWLKETFAPGERLEQRQIMQHVSGRLRTATDGDDESPYCSLANGFFQGLLGDLAKAAVRRISRECYDRTIRVPDFAYENSVKSRFAGGESPLYGSRLIVFQHDEILPEMPESVAHEAANRISEIMVDEMRWYCPDLAPAAKAPPALMEKWYKGAEPVYLHGLVGKDGKVDKSKPRDEYDRLVPWRPATLAA